MDHRPKRKMQNTKLLEANKGEHLDDPGLGDDFLDIKGKIHQRKKKPDKLDVTKILKFFPVKDTVKRMKRQGENICKRQI